MIVRALVLVVVHQLRSRGDRLRGFDEDPFPIVDRFAVRLARVIDEARLVPVHRSVDARLVVDREEERMMAVHLLVVVSLVRGLPRDALAEILDDARALLDGPGGKCTRTLDL